MPFTATAKFDAHALFDDQRPSPGGIKPTVKTAFNCDAAND